MRKLLSRVSVLFLIGAGTVGACSQEGTNYKSTKGKTLGIEESLKGLNGQTGVTADALGKLRTEGRMSGELLAAILEGLQDQIDALKKRDEELAREIGDVRTSLGERIAAVEARVKILEDDSTRKAEQITALESRASVLESRADSAEREIAAIEGDIDDIRRDLVQNYATKSELAVLKEAQDKILNNLSLLNSEIYGEGSFDNLLAMADNPEDLKSRLDGVDTQLNEAFDRLATNEGAIAAHAQLLTQYKNDFDARKIEIDRKLGEIEEQIASGDGAINERLDDLYVDLGEMNIRINNTSTNIGSFFEAATGGTYNESDTRQMQMEIAQYFTMTRDFETSTLQRLTELNDDIVTAQQRADAAYTLADDSRVDLENQLDALTGRVDGIQGQLEAFTSTVEGELESLGNKVMTMLAGRTPAEFAEQFSSTVTEFATLKTRFNTLEEGLDARILGHIETETADLRDSVENLEIVQSVTNIQLPAATNYLREYSAESLRLLSAFVDAIAPASGGTHARDLSNTFERDVWGAQACSAFIRRDADFKNAFGVDYFMILARYYGEAFAHGWRNGTASGGIFHGMPGFTGDSNELLRMTLAPLFELTLPPAETEEAQRNAATCLVEVREWAHDILLGDEEVANAFQQALAANQTVRALLETLNTIGNQAAEPLEIIASTISGEFPAAFQQLQAEVAQHTQQILELEQRMENAERRMNTEFVTATEFAEATAGLTGTDGNLQTQLDGLQTQFTEITTRINDLSNEFDEFKAQQAGVNSQLFGMVAAIASHLNMDDIAARAAANVVPLQTDAALPTPTGTESGLGIHNAGLSFMECSNLAGTSGFSTGGWITGQFDWMGDACSVNFRRIPNESIPDTLTIGGFRLRLATTGVQEVSVQTQLGHGWQETTSLIAGTEQVGRFNLRSLTPENKVVAVSGDWIVGLFDLNVVDLIAAALEGESNKRVRFTIQGYGANGSPVGSQIVVDIGFYSPLILNFAGTHTVATSAAVNSGVRFDLDADGRPEQTGWLARGTTVGLLAMDLNKNGRIDDGSELFGEATELSTGVRAQNGYLALSNLDKNRDGRVDSKDQDFAKLQVWFDRNLNGQTEKGELVSITEAGVTALSTKYEEVTDQSKRARSVLDNDHRYEARFWGPAACGEEGCATYDIYFSKTTELSRK